MVALVTWQYTRSRFPFFSMRRGWQILFLVLLFLFISGLSAYGVYALSYRQSGEFHAGTPQQKNPVLPVPDHESAVALVSTTMKDFARALAEKDFTNFLGNASLLWQKRTTPKKIIASFKGFLPFAREVRQAVGDDPVLNAQPLLNEKGNLVLQGFYRIEATKMLFQLQYVYDAPAWKLLGMNVEVK